MSAFDVGRFRQALRTRLMGQHFQHFPVVASTNTTAHLFGHQGKPEGTVVFADAQTAGRGQRGRAWISPPERNIYVSILLRPPIAPAQGPLISLLAAVGLVDALGHEGMKSGIKWPNDVLIEGRKVAGILTEMETDGAAVQFVIVGIGINVNMTQADLDRDLGSIAATATSVQVVLGHEISRETLLAGLLASLERWYNIFRTAGSRPLCDAWEARSFMRGRRIIARTSEFTWEGTAEGIDPAGHLLMRKDDGSLTTLISAEVRFLE